MFNSNSETLLIYKNHDDDVSLPPRASRFTPSSTLIMWAKLSGALKHRPTVEETQPASPDVMSGVLEKHPNLSVFHSDDDSENRPAEVPFPVPSPPGSPSRHRSGVFRRISRSAKHDSGEPSKASSALKLPLFLPKKVKSHISLHTNGKRIPARHCSAAHMTITIIPSLSIVRQHCTRFRKTSANRYHETVN